jgi:DNA-binding response OmpR family regulator
MARAMLQLSASPPADGGAMIKARRKATVLVVDDTAAVGTTLMWVLRDSGYNCTAVATRAEALQVCAGVAPDLALIELNLPDGSGVDTVRDLRRRLPGCRMLLMSSDPEAGDYLMQVPAGLDCELLPKPIAVEELLQRVKEALAQPA